MEPALASLFARPAVPGDAERLVAPAGEGNQVLLQRIDAERVRDLVVVKRAVGAVGAYDVLALAPREGRDDTGVLEGGSVEVAEHRRLAHLFHGTVVVRPAPGLGLGRMTLDAGPGLLRK